HLEKAVPRFITSCILEEPLTVHGDGSAGRDWLFVEDHAAALDGLIHVDRDKVVGEVINLGTGHDISVLKIAEAVRDMMQPRVSGIQFIGNRPGQVDRHTADASKAKRLLGWEPTTPFEVALERTVAWYRQHEDWWRPQMWMRSIPIVA